MMWRLHPCSVAKKFLDDMELGSDSIRAAVIEFMPYSFSAVEIQAKKFFEVGPSCDAHIVTGIHERMRQEHHAACNVCGNLPAVHTPIP